MSFGLPSSVRAWLFDLDGVLKPTARVHARGRKEMFDAYLRGRAHASGMASVPFDPVADSDRCDDGKPPADGTRSFLAPREIKLPEGHDDDAPDMDSVRGLGIRKIEIVTRRLR